MFLSARSGAATVEPADAAQVQLQAGLSKREREVARLLVAGYSGVNVAAIAGLGADKAPARLVLILGGDGKGQDFAPLAAPVARHARAVALIGRDAGAIESVLQGAGVPLLRHDTLEAATRWCFEQARPGDAVLLSPACASLDMFRNYAHRAQVFADTVKALALEHGEIAA